MRMSCIKAITGMVLVAGIAACNTHETDRNPVSHESMSPYSFSFAFFTDLHLSNHRPESFEAFRQAVDSALAKNVEFIVTGGDNLDIDAMGGEEINEARELYQKFKNEIGESGTRFKLTIGNHDRYWYLGNTEVTYGSELFSEYFGKTYYSWDHKGVRFIHLNTAEVCDGNYCISEKQKQWLKQTLDQTPKTQPLVIIAHVPFLSLYYPALEGYFTHTDIFSGFKEVWNMFSAHNVQLVLQGHMHLFEEINVLGTQFVTGGALSANWWDGSFFGTEEGFVLINWDGYKMSWEYFDIGWNAEKN